MNLIIGMAMVFCIVLAGMLYLICRKLVTDASLPTEDDWLQNLSPLRYRPMERLLDAGEYRRLESHPAFTAKMRRNIRARRVRLFREYLRCLSLDYSRVCKTIKLLMVQSPQDRADLAGVLIRHRVQFTLRLVMAEFWLTFHALGVGVDTSKLVAALDSMRLELNTLLEAKPFAAAA